MPRYNQNKSGDQNGNAESNQRKVSRVHLRPERRRYVATAGGSMYVDGMPAVSVEAGFCDRKKSTPPLTRNRRGRNLLVLRVTSPDSQQETGLLTCHSNTSAHILTEHPLTFQSGVSLNRAGWKRQRTLTGCRTAVPGSVQQSRPFLLSFFMGGRGVFASLHHPATSK